MRLDRRDAWHDGEMSIEAKRLRSGKERHPDRELGVLGRNLLGNDLSRMVRILVFQSSDGWIRADILKKYSMIRGGELEMKSLPVGIVVWNAEKSWGALGFDEFEDAINRAEMKENDARRVRLSRGRLRARLSY